MFSSSFSRSLVASGVTLVVPFWLFAPKFWEVAGSNEWFIVIL